MSFPAFFDTAPTITLRDPLADLLGASRNGIIEYSYGDIVKLAGHSCPTVAGAYLMTRNALKKLYGDDLPERGDIKVEFQDDQTNGVTGVIANVISMITGATIDTGFKGLGGKYDRRGLLFFNVDIPGEIRYTRLDTGAAITTSYHASIVPPSPELMPALRTIIAGQGDSVRNEEFGQAWQERVRKILENADNPALVTYA
ncbi:FmdE family protein [Pusillimonas sp. ANT_WB101]|uniref:FmdE family protein n=1 Tax=Pusillimonas sp. ANT_WB101 TaxID=2597356 RepID=UPI0011EEC1A8|nr:FmdE family protein [Pusillimonas sp. ANT_WB101]KAA0890757.1 hypothetical protein FQ179_13910 [Pusillimonas sp. ANT_WB101]